MNIQLSAPATARFLETTSSAASSAGPSTPLSSDPTTGLHLGGSEITAMWPWDPAPKGDVAFSFQMQDQYVMPPSTTIVHGVKGGVFTDQVELRDHKPKPVNGAYVYGPASIELPATQAFATAAKTVETFAGAFGTKIPWAFGGARLGIHPDQGDDLNAYYARDDASLNFFHATDKVTNRLLFSAGSGEVVAHEVGHAILDAMRPDYFSAWSSDAGAFHESFGDVTAIIMSLLDARSRAKAIEQTGGDLTKPNVIANVGEELGVAINHATGRNATGGDYTRTALNALTWQNPSTLPSNPKDPSQLGSEFHNFSRLFTGAVYDVMAGINARHQHEGMSADAALERTGQDVLALYASLMKTAPTGDFTFKDMAAALVAADRRYHEGTNTSLIASVFKARKILPEDFDPTKVTLETASRPVAAIETVLRGADLGRFEGARVSTPLSGSALVRSGEAEQKLESDVKRLIAQGRILYTTPDQIVRPRDLFDGQGRPYVGVVRWLDGQMTIERVKIAS
ncbi:MAG: hypothetical protein EB084_05160 [Proteobacteria bacterium]|nr:hypothetical protein [Pseudomonadota bacterium]